jgi:hypothetical protein
VSQIDPFDYLDLLSYLDQQDSEAQPRKRLPRRNLLKMLAGGGLLGAGAAVFGAGFLTRSLTKGSPTATTAVAADPHQHAAGAEDASQIAAKLLPAEGVSISVAWGDTMPRLVEAGVVDVAKFSDAASRSGAPLTEDQQRILSSPSDQPVRIDAKNSRFVLNSLWALGLANKNQVLANGPMASLEDARKAQLASTAGWTLGREPGPQYLAQLDLVPLTGEQQAVLEEVAYGSYRPCCDNPTGFPDCNHGSAALALAELAAAQGASADEIFAALRGFNSFWYPNQYYLLAIYFERQGQAWEDVNPRLVLGAEYSSGSGWKRVAAAVQSQGLPGQLPGQAGGCGA